MMAFLALNVEITADPVGKVMMILKKPEERRDGRG